MEHLKMCMAVLGLAAAMTSCTTQPANPIDALYDKMSQEERLAQLQGSYDLETFFDENNRIDTVKCAERLANGVGHFSQFALGTQKSPNELRDMIAQMQSWLMTHTPNGIPALFHEEVLSGINARGATVYPQQIGLACSFNPALAQQKTFQTASDLRQMGGALALSPMVDVVRTPSFNRLEESYGEDAYLSAAMGVAFVKGLQHGDLRQGVAACTKHFLGYGGGGDAPKKELMEEILLPHEAIIRTAGSQVVMTGYHAVDGTKCVANRQLQQGILRDYLHFPGVMVSDYGSIEQIDDSMTDVQRAAAAINAGNDVDFPGGSSYRHLLEAIDQGLVTQQTFETAVKRVLQLKSQLGLLDAEPALCSHETIEFDRPEERQTAYELATQSVVMLRNNGVLPFAHPMKIALVGPNANTMWAMLGDYSYQSMRYFWRSSVEDDMHPRIVSLKAGLEQRKPEGFTVGYERGCDWTDSVETVVDKSGDPRVAYLVKIQNRKVDSGEKADWTAAMKLARKSDVIVAAVGENVMLCGENRDRTSLRLPGRQEDFVRQLLATGKPVVLVVFGGRAQVLNGLDDACAAVIQAWYPGEEGGNALADILYGKVNPSGKLSVSYPAVEIHDPICYNYGPMNLDSIAYPFGYGLSYTTFAYSGMRVDATAATDADFFDVSVDVENAGKVMGDEVVQLYVSPVDAATPIKPIQLQGFKRVTLQPGQKQTVAFKLSPQQLGYYNQGQWTVAPGKYRIQAAASSTDIRQQGVIELTGKEHTLPLRTHYLAE